MPERIGLHDRTWRGDSLPSRRAERQQNLQNARKKEKSSISRGKTRKIDRATDLFDREKKTQQKRRGGRNGLFDYDRRALGKFPGVLT